MAMLLAALAFQVRHKAKIYASSIIALVRADLERLDWHEALVLPATVVNHTSPGTPVTNRYIDLRGGLSLLSP